jgi:putative hydrolase of the HAD superfamily
VATPSAVLLDLDDTILADAVSVDDCWETACLRFADRLDGVAAGELLAAILEYSEWYWDDPERHRRGRLDLPRARHEVVAGALDRLEIVDESLATELAHAYATRRDELMRPFPGAIETLDWLRRRGVRSALLTNGAAQAQRAKLERFGLARYFDCIVIEGELGAGKPEERVYRHALERLETPPDEAWMVGDNLEWDVAAPQRLGIAGVWVDCFARGLPDGTLVRPDWIIGSLSELRNLLA